MRRQGVLFLRISALVSSLMLLTSFVALRAGLLSSPTVLGTIVTQDQSPSPHNLNSIEPMPPQENQALVQINSTDGNQSELIPIIGTVSEMKAGRGADFNQRDSPPEKLPEISTSAMMLPPAIQLGLEALPESSAQIRKDAITLMSSSKSIVILPKTPIEWETAVAKLKSQASSFFHLRDRNRDGKLTKKEMDPEDWKILERDGAVKDGAVDEDGLLKSYVSIVMKPRKRNEK